MLRGMAHKITTTYADMDKLHRKREATQHKKQTQVENNNDSCDRHVMWPVFALLIYSLQAQIGLSNLEEALVCLYVMPQLFNTPLVEYTLPSHYKDGCLFVWTQHVTVCIKFPLNDRKGQTNSPSLHFGRAPRTHNGRDRVIPFSSLRLR